MKHFIFLALAYGDKVFSIIDNPRMASDMEKNYFYNPRWDFLKKMQNSYSEADKKIARYLLGALIAMKAVVKLHKGVPVDNIVKDIAQGFKTLKVWASPGLYTNNF